MNAFHKHSHLARHFVYARQILWSAILTSALGDRSISLQFSSIDYSIPRTIKVWKEERIYTYIATNKDWTNRQKHPKFYSMQDLTDAKKQKEQLLYWACDIGIAEGGARTHDLEVDLFAVIRATRSTDWALNLLLGLDIVVRRRKLTYTPAELNSDVNLRWTWSCNTTYILCSPLAVSQS